MKINVTFFCRYAVSAWSIERVFDGIIQHLPNDIRAVVCRNRYSSKGLFKRLFDMLRAMRHQGDVNHITGDVHYLSYFLRKNRTIITIHDCGMLESSSGIKKWLFRILWIWLPVRCCCFVVAISRATRDQIIKEANCQVEKIKVIHDPVDPRFKPIEKPFSVHQPRVLHVGTKENKNLYRHVDALMDFPCEFVIIGKLNHEQKRYLDNSAITYINKYNLSDAELVDEYVQSDLLLFASTFEGFGLPIVEAQAVGRPVVTSTLWSMPEVAGDAACLVDPYDVTSIRAGIQRVIYDEHYRNGLITRGYQNVKRFEVQTIAEQYASLYREVARV